LTSNQYGINISSSGFVYGIFTYVGNDSISIKGTNNAGTLVYQNYTITIKVDPLGTPEFTFAGASDGHLGNPGNPNGSMQVALVNSAKAQSLNMIFDLGDLVNGVSGSGIGATVANYSMIKGIYDNSGIPYHVAMGNHDNISAFNEVFPGSLDYYVIKDKIIWIVLNASIEPVVSINSTQLDFLNNTLSSHKDYLAFVMCHEGQKQIHWPAGYPEGEANDTRFQQIIETNSYHMGGVLFAHAHCAGTTAGNSTYYTYTGTYGSTNQNGFDYQMGYDMFGIFKNSSTSEYTIKVWYEVLVNNSALSSTYFEYKITLPINQTQTSYQIETVIMIVVAGLIVVGSIVIIVHRKGNRG
jgi:hypothetical protein